MATISEIQSLEKVDYKIKVRKFFLIIGLGFTFIFAFLSSFQIEPKVKSLIQSSLAGSGCTIDFRNIDLELLLPKLVVTDLTVPARCLNRNGEALKFNYLKINFQLISFSPLGLPFKLETEFGGQPISFYFIQGFGDQMIRVKDQTLQLSRLQKFFGDNIKLAGNATIDLNLLMSDQLIKSLSLKVLSRNLQVPSMNLEGFVTPHLKLNELYLEATSNNPPRITVSKVILGDPDSAVRANMKGKIDLQEGSLEFSPLDLTGEIAFSSDFKEALPLIDMMFQQYTQKDGFYQIRLGGTLGAPKLVSP